MESTKVFNAKYISGWLPDRQYRIYVIGNEMFFIRIGGQDVQAALTHQFGLLGGLIGTLLQKRSEKKKAALIQNIDQMNPEQLLAEHKHNFKVNSIEFESATVEPRSFFASHGPHVGLWKFNLKDGRKMKLQFDNNEDLQSALNILPQLLSNSVRGNVEWNENKKRFQKRKE
jgi:hypothetical protein